MEKTKEKVKRINFLMPSQLKKQIKLLSVKKEKTFPDTMIELLVIGLAQARSKE